MQTRESHDSSVVSFITHPSIKSHLNYWKSVLYKLKNKKVQTYISYYEKEDWFGVWKYPTHIFASKKQKKQRKRRKKKDF